MAALTKGDKVLIRAEVTRTADDFVEVGVWLEGTQYHGWFKQSEVVPVNSSCPFKEYCLSAERRGECRKCKKYDKFERKKSKSRQATGRANKRKGKESEKKLLLHFQRQGIPARIIEGSGAYKKSKGEGFDSDLRVTIYDKERKVENKKYGSKVSALAKIRKLIGENGILYISGFCYVLDENVFYDIVKNANGVDYLRSGTAFIQCPEKCYSIKEVSDRDYGWLHNFFEQDYADIVSLDENYRDFLFCLQPNLMKEILHEV